jgi:hypothetical protein
MTLSQAFLLALGACAAVASPALAAPFVDPRSERSPAIEAAAAAEARDPACYTAALVSTGGPPPHNPHTLAVRWTGVSNYELAYKGRVILLDAFFDRPAPYHGLKAADVQRADVILLGHGHFDHMSDAASVGARTGAKVVAAPITMDKLLTQSIDAKQLLTVTGRGGETLDFKDFKVEPILARHGEPSKEITAVMEKAVNSLSAQSTPEQKAEDAVIEARGTADPRVITEGTIAYLITLDDGFRIMYRDSGGKLTDYEKSAMARIGRVDLAIIRCGARPSRCFNRHGVTRIPRAGVLQHRIQPAERALVRTRCTCARRSAGNLSLRRSPRTPIRMAGSEFCLFERLKTARRALGVCHGAL